MHRERQTQYATRVRTESLQSILFGVQGARQLLPKVFAIATMINYILECGCDFVTSIGMSHDSACAAAADSSSRIHVWSLTTGEFRGQLALPHTDSRYTTVEWVEFLPEGLELLALDSDGCLWHWHLDSHDCRQVGERDSPIAIAALARTGQLAALGTDHGAILLWDVRQDQLFDVLKEGERRETLITALASSPTGSSVAVAKEDDTSIHIYSAADGLCNRMRGHSDVILSIDYSPNGLFVASASRDNSVRLWEVEHGRQVAVAHGPGNIIRAVAFSPTGRLLAIGNGYRSFSTNNPASVVSLFQVPAMSEVGSLAGHLDSVECLYFSQDGQALASGGHDGRVIVWEIREN